MSEDRTEALPDRSRAEREARLAAALRANLRRRKAQARGREAAAPASPEAEGPPAREGEGKDPAPP